MYTVMENSNNNNKNNNNSNGNNADLELDRFKQILNNKISEKKNQIFPTIIEDGSTDYIAFRLNYNAAYEST